MSIASRVPHTNDNAPVAQHAAGLTLGLGPNQLKWLRRNMDAFREAEEQRYYVRQDAVRAARLAGIG